ncbi:sulfatase family protein [Arenibacter echinorum]|uniref:Arylsulfatase A-like enzyme n=1 Tax=Arenibacter echinorum TaxID=440515 RepID=A0A327R659_9FLAO|nr:sulfatase [Arenibacter echinorum]RAJ12340.1 arylsulfatase A-like enzyme [Arenibacter echinorum]
MKKIQKTAQSIVFILTIVVFISCKNENTAIQTNRPNILFAIMDDATYEHMGIYGCDWIKTPNFDRIANEGLLFSRAYTPNAKCAPSRSIILTGRNSWQLEEAANHWAYFPTKFKTYAEVLEDNGYHVGYTDKGWAPGIAKWENGEERFLVGKPYNEKRTDPPGDHISTNDYAANFSDFLSANKESSPFCFWFGSREPHRAYDKGIGIERGGKKLEEIDKVYSFWPDNETVRGDLLDYAYEIEYFDNQLGKMLKTLEDREELDNTVIVVTSDNGMPFPRVKGQDYELSNHLPLAIMWKMGIKSPGRNIKDIVSFADFAPTFLELAKIEPSEHGMKPITGKSLRPIFSSTKSINIDSSRDDFVLLGKERHDVGRPNDWGYPIRGIVKEDYLFIRNFETSRWPAGNPVTGYLNCDGSPTKTEVLALRKNLETFHYWDSNFGKRPEFELYNIKQDPECMVNIFGNPDYSKTSEELNTLMIDELKRQEDPRILGNGQIFDNYVYADSTGVNFYERYLDGEELGTSWVNPSDFEDIKD